MGFATVAAEAILLVAVIVCASIFASTITAKMIEMKQSVDVKTKDVVETAKTEVVIAYITYDDSEGCFKVYIKNVGKVPVYDVRKFTIVFGEYGKATLHEYSSPAIPGTWNYTEYDTANNILDVQEIISINIFNSTTLTNPCYVKIVLPNGMSVEEVFTYGT